MPGTVLHSMDYPLLPSSRAAWSATRLSTSGRCWAFHSLFHLAYIPLILRGSGRT